MNARAEQFTFLRRAIAVGLYFEHRQRINKVAGLIGIRFGLVCNRIRDDAQRDHRLRGEGRDQKGKRGGWQVTHGGEWVGLNLSSTNIYGVSTVRSPRVA